MKLTLMIEAAPAALASILANLPNGATASLPPAAVTGPAPAASDDDDDTTGDTPAAVGQLDKDGLPHDPRIHSETPTLTGKGVWRKRRGVSKDTIDSVEAELRAKVASTPPPPLAPAQPAPQPAPVAPAAPPMPMPSPEAAPQPAPPVPQMPQPAPVTPAAPPPMPTNPEPAPEPAQAPAAPTAGQLDFAGFMQHMSGQMQKRDAQGQPLIHDAYLTQITAEIAQAFNQPLNSIVDISTNPQMINYAVGAFQRDGRW